MLSLSIFIFKEHLVYYVVLLLLQGICQQLQTLIVSIFYHCCWHIFDMHKASTTHEGSDLSLCLLLSSFFHADILLNDDNKMHLRKNGKTIKNCAIYIVAQLGNTFFRKSQFFAMKLGEKRPTALQKERGMLKDSACSTLSLPYR